MTPKRIGWLVVLALAIALVTWIARHTYWTDLKIPMPVKAEAFAITRGKPKHWRRTGASGIESTYWFCGGCGGQVFGQRRVRPDVVSVRAGTLDDTSWVRPIAHVCMSNAQPWERMTNDVECFDTMPGDLWALAGKWQELWEGS